MKIINGRKIADDVVYHLASLPRLEKYLAGILVGGDPILMSFLKIKQKTAERLGIDFRIFEFPSAISQDDLCKEVMKIADDPKCGGIVVELPLPKHINPHVILDIVPPEKDPDVLSSWALENFYAGHSAIAPLSVETVTAVLAAANFPSRIRKAVVVGAGFLIGKPVANGLKKRADEVVVVDKGDDFSVLVDADVVVCGAGVPGLVRADMLKKGAGVIDFGYTVLDGKPSGDFDATGESVHDLSFYTPTPGGTGPVLVAKLFENFYLLNK
jgi:methylenetetrahydrofolate dehydrogenase (NADP+)/methenyltetrahydrofolate cyclohydrolase